MIKIVLLFIYLIDFLIQSIYFCLLLCELAVVTLLQKRKLMLEILILELHCSDFILKLQLLALNNMDLIW